MAAHGASVLFAGGGEMGARMRAFDWAKTPLGPVEAWPRSLRTCVRIILTSRQPMFVWWGDSLINLYNDAYKAIVGRKHPEALGQPASVVWSEIWDQVGPRAYTAMRQNEGTYDEALQLIMERNGYPEETYYTFSYSPVPNDEGGTGGILCANSDDTHGIIGERQLSLLRMLASETADARTAEEVCERAMRSLASNDRDLPFALLYLPDPGEQFMKLMGSTGISKGHVAAPPHLPGASAHGWPLPQSPDQPLQVVSDLCARFGDLPCGAWPKPPSQAAIATVAPSGDSGRVGVLIVGLNPFRLFDDAYAGFIKLVAGQIAASIANAEAYEQERKRAEMLAELDRAKTTFFSNISHEFRTPLTLMLGPLEDAMASSARQLSSANLEIAYRNALRLLKLVNALLDFSRIEAGRADACFQPTDLPALTADLASAFRSAMERAGLLLRVEVEPFGEPIYVDHDMWEKIVLNLLSNAFKFTFEGEVRVGLHLTDTHAELSVSDTGTGIPAQELANVFKRFHRVQGSRSRTHEGSGIGLALVNELVRLHGGSICVASTEGRGTTFTVSIPRGSRHLSRERLGATRALSSTATGAAPYVQEAERWLPPERRHELPTRPEELVTPALPQSEHEAPARILVADDNADMREYLARLLGTRFQVYTVADGAEALRAALTEPPDLVLTDVMMPNLDGFGLLRKLRAEPRTRSIPVVMLSARAGEESRVEGLEAGADDYLVKPFSAREVVARVSTHLQIARLRATAERERRKLFEVFMQAPLPVAVLMGPELRFEVANPAYCDLAGRRPETGQTLRQVFPELVQHEALQAIEEVLASGQPLQMVESKVPLWRAGVLSDRYFNFVAHPLRGEAVSEGVVILATEVTEQVLSRTRIEHLRDEAERANRAKDDFLSTLSHELRTPLNAIVGWSKLLRGGGLDGERAARALETIERNAQVQARLIEDMLDLSRIEQGKLVLSVGPVEMVRVVEAALDAVRPAADAKGVRLQPVLDSHATIVGDADRLQQVVWNLLSNAIKFTPRGGRVQVRLRRHDSHVEVAVADTGQGIAPDFLPLVFDRFRQADPSYTRKAGGLGLGLAIVRSLVELHGGVVAAQSDGPNSGATFVVKLPTAPLRADRAPPAPVSEAGAPVGVIFECPPELKGVRVLVIDDELDTRELLKFLLEQCEARVQTAADATEALAMLEHTAFDILISDIGMPEMDGHTFMRALRSRAAHAGGATPALALTAYARSEDRTQALRAGFNMHLAKPIEPAELLVVLATLIRSVAHRPAGA